LIKIIDTIKKEYIILKQNKRMEDWKMTQEQNTTQEVKIDRQKVEEVLEQIRPALRFDGGDVELVDIGNDGTVYVRLMGACHGCAMSLVTLKGGIEMKLKEAIPEVKEVVAVNLGQPPF